MRERHTYHFSALLVAEGQLVGCEHQRWQREADALVPASSKVFSCRVQNLPPKTQIR